MNSDKDDRASGDMDMDGTDYELVGGTGDMNSIDTKNIFRTLSNPDGDPTGGLVGAHEGHAGTRWGQGTSEPDSQEGEVDSDWEVDWYCKDKGGGAEQWVGSSGPGHASIGHETEQGPGRSGPEHAMTCKQMATDVECAQRDANPCG